MTESTSAASRRDFLATSSAAAGLALATSLAPRVHAGGSDVLKIGLIGCGGRGTGAASQALNADPNVKLVALGDAFEDKAKSCLDTLKKENEIANKIDVKPECCFTGFDAYKKVIAAGVDVVLLAAPPHFRPAHLAAAVEAGKHVFAEKPIAVDAPGVRSVLETCKKAKAKDLAVVSGLCYRYEHAKRETMKRIHDGQIGEVVALHTNYMMGGLWNRPRQDGWTDMEWQLRNWLYFTWLSGDHNVEQHIHSLDKMAWAMGNKYPVRAYGLGGRQARTDVAFGHIFDHHAVVYEFDGGAKCFSFCRQQKDVKFVDVNDYVMGTQGTADIQKHTIKGPKGQNAWKKERDRKDNMYQNEHNELFASIRAGKPINDGEWMSHSTLMAIMGRMATYTGELITWEQAMASAETLGPAKYEWGALPMPEVAKPGVTKFA